MRGCPTAQPEGVCRLDAALQPSWDLWCWPASVLSTLLVLQMPDSRLPLGWKAQRMGKGPCIFL